MEGQTTQSFCRQTRDPFYFGQILGLVDPYELGFTKGIEHNNLVSVILYIVPYAQTSTMDSLKCEQ